MTHDTRKIADLTVAEFIELHQSINSKSNTQEPKQPLVTDQYVYGLSGIAKLFGCGLTKANEIKASGIIDPAIKQLGRVIIVDAKKAIELIDQKKRR